MNSCLQGVEGGQTRGIQERKEIRRGDERGGQGIVAGSKKRRPKLANSKYDSEFGLIYPGTIKVQLQ